MSSGQFPISSDRRGSSPGLLTTGDSNLDKEGGPNTSTYKYSLLWMPKATGGRAKILQVIPVVQVAVLRATSISKTRVSMTLGPIESLPSELTRKEVNKQMVLRRFVQYKLRKTERTS